MSGRRVLLAGLSALGLTSGCAGIVYQKVYTADGTVNENPASPPAGAFAFGLRKAVIVITAGPGSGSASASPASGANASTTPVAIECTGKLHNDCTGKIAITATPTTDPSAAYFARPRSGARWLGGTTLSPKSDATDPLLIQSVTFGYNNKVANIVTAAGTGFTAGLSFGPAGAWTGLLLGAVGAAGLTPHIADGQEKQPWAMSVLCAPPTPDGVGAYLDSLPKKAVLWLPVTVDYPSVDPVAGCWHALPGAPEAKATATTPAPSTANTGWFYRVLPTEAKPPKVSAVPPVLASKTLQEPLVAPFAIADRYLTDGQPKKTFPVTACRAVAVELVWWQDIARIDNGALNPDDVAALAKTQVVAAADPNVVQLLNVSSGTTVTLLSCGGFASPGAPSTAMSDDINAVIKQAQAIKAAQTPAAPKK